MTKLFHLLCVLALAYNGSSFLFEESKETSRHGSFARFGAFMTELTQEYDKFKRNYNRVYKNAEEEEKRFLTFTDSYIFVKQVNNLYEQGKCSYKVGINQFSDMTDQERKARKCFKPNRSFRSSLENAGLVNDYGSGKRVQPPNTVDWRAHNYVTPVKDQGQCGSCYAFSTTGSLEGQHFRKTGLLVSLSEQQIVDCSVSFGDDGCQGGEISAGFEYIYSSGGIELEQSYPYTSGSTMHKNAKCNFDNSSIGAKIIGYANITPSGDEQRLEETVARVGPVSVAIDANHLSFMHYMEGVYYNPLCQNNYDGLDHAVLVVGYGVENGIPYWLVKNSWGTKWGQDGYVKMRRNTNNMCGIATAATYPIL